MDMIPMQMRDNNVEIMGNRVAVLMGDQLSEIAETGTGIAEDE